MRDKARGILTQLSQGAIDKASPQSNSNSSNKDDDHDELAIFAGRTRFITSGTKSRSPTRSPQAVGSVMPTSSPRRRGSDSLGSNMPGPEASARRGSESFGHISQSESDIFRQAHPSLLEYMRGINGYVPPPAILMAGRGDEGRESASSSAIRPPVPKSDVQSPSGYSWADQAVSVSPPSGPFTFGFERQQRQHQHPLDLGQDNGPMGQDGIYVPGGPANHGAVMAQAVGTFGYPGELNGDGTWQQLMVQLGVMEGQN